MRFQTFLFTIPVMLGLAFGNAGLDAVHARQADERSTVDLDRIRDMGRWLAVHLELCEKAGARLAQTPSPEPDVPCMAKRTETGWVAAYGDLDTTALTFTLRQLVHFDRKRDVLSHEFTEVVDSTEWVTAALAGEHIRRVAEREPDVDYYTIILKYPWEDSVVTAYFLPRDAATGRLLFGGDTRLRMDASTREVLDVTKLHNSIHDLRPPPDSDAAASMHAAVLTDLPVETDVLMVLMRQSSIPHIVVTERYAYSIAPSGRIAAVRR